MALLVFAGALWFLQRGDATPAPVVDISSGRDEKRAAQTPAPDDREPPPATPSRATAPQGLALGKTRGPDARSKAQAILDDALAELRRLDDRHRTLARDVYMRGHSAAERVEDELDEGDEPGLAKLRADEDAMKAELQRIYGVTDDP